MTTIKDKLQKILEYATEAESYLQLNDVNSARKLLSEIRATTKLLLQDEHNMKRLVDTLESNL